MMIVVTGGTRGLGKAIAARLGGAGHDVVVVGRDHSATLVADLSRLSEMRRVAEEVGSVDALINNAGVSKARCELTEDGLETTFAVNHMAPFVLSNLLLPKKIITIASEQHRFVRAIPWDDLQGERRFRQLEQYSLTKLYNILFTRELARRTRDRGLLVNCLSPGFLRTDLGREATGAFKVFLALALPIRRPPDVGAEAVAHALDATTTGAYFRGKKEAPPSKLALDDAAATRLWEVSWKLGAHALEAAKLR